MIWFKDIATVILNQTPKRELYLTLTQTSDPRKHSDADRMTHDTHTQGQTWLISWSKQGKTTHIPCLLFKTHNPFKNI